MENELRKKFNLLNIWKPFAPDPTTFSDRMAPEGLPDFEKIGNDVELAISVSKNLESLLKKYFVFQRFDDDLPLGKLVKASYLRQFVKDLIIKYIVETRNAIVHKLEKTCFTESERSIFQECNKATLTYLSEKNQIDQLMNSCLTKNEANRIKELDKESYELDILFERKIFLIVKNAKLNSQNLQNTPTLKACERNMSENGLDTLISNPSHTSNQKIHETIAYKNIETNFDFLLGHGLFYMSVYNFVIVGVLLISLLACGGQISTFGLFCYLVFSIVASVVLVNGFLVEVFKKVFDTDKNVVLLIVSRLDWHKFLSDLKAMRLCWNIMPLLLTMMLEIFIIVVTQMLRVVKMVFLRRKE